MINLLGETQTSADEVARSLVRSRGKRYDIIHKYGTNRGLALIAADGTECENASKSGLYAVYGPKIVGKNSVDLSTDICYYVGYAGLGNTIRNRLSRFVVEMLGASSEFESHRAAKSLSETVGKNVSRLLKVHVMPYDIRDWDMYASFRSEIIAWKKIESEVITELNPILNKRKL